MGKFGALYQDPIGDLFARGRPYRAVCPYGIRRIQKTNIETLRSKAERAFNIDGYAHPVPFFTGDRRNRHGNHTRFGLGGVARSALPRRVNCSHPVGVFDIFNDIRVNEARVAQRRVRVQNPFSRFV